MNYAQHGRDLLLELKRSEAGGNSRSTSHGASSLPPYNDRLVRAGLQDLALHVQALQDQADVHAATSTVSGEKISMAMRPSVLLQNAAVRRHKRCLLAYHKIRADRLTAAYWVDAMPTKGGAAANDTNGDAPQILSPAEEEFAQAQATLVRQYTTAWKLPTLVDLRSYTSGGPPQPCSHIQVRVVQAPSDGGAIVLESGRTVTLAVGSLHYLPYADVEGLLREGSLQVVSTEEEDDLHMTQQAAGAARA
jgi:GINS complex subunit 1